MLILNENEEVLIKSNDGKSSIVSIYNDGKYMHIEQLEKREYEMTYKERQKDRIKK